MLDDIQLFNTVVATGSFSAAARRIGLTASSVARRIKELEQDVGTDLVHRTTRSMSLTAAGRLFHERTSRIASDIKDAKEEVSAMDSHLRGTLRITAPVTFGMLHVAPLVANLSFRYPELAVELSLEDDHVDLVEQGYDVGIRLGKLPDSTLVATKLTGLKRATVATPEYFESHGYPKGPRELVNHHCLQIFNCPAQSWHFVDPDDGFRRYPVGGKLKANNAEAILSFALAGAGIAHLPTWLLSKHLLDGTLVQVMPEFEADEGYRGGIFAVRPGSRVAPAKVKAFVALARDAFRPISAFELSKEQIMLTPFSAGGEPPRQLAIVGKAKDREPASAP